MNAPSTPHTCHADGCKDLVPPALLMCEKHWSMVPKALQGLIWRHYRTGQENDIGRVTPDYLLVAAAAENAVAAKEGRPMPNRLTVWSWGVDERVVAEIHRAAPAAWMVMS